MVAEQAQGTALVERGRTALDRVAAELDALHAATGVPVTARRPWLSRWAAAHPEVEPVLVGVRQGPGTDGLAAAAPLALRRRRGVLQVGLLGAPHSDYLRLPARDVTAADRLAGAIADLLASVRGPWVLELEQLPAGDPTAAALTRALRYAALAPGDGAPRLRLTPDGGTPTAHLSTNTRRSVRQGWNRLAADGHDVRVEHVRTPDLVLDLLPELRRVHRLREHAVGRADDLADPRAEAFWTEVVAGGAVRGEVGVAVLRAGDRVVAYELGLLDGSAYRLWDGRFDPDYARYGPGRLLQAHLVEALLAEGGWTELDLMRGEEPYKLRLADDVVPSEVLRAWSSPLVRAGDVAPRSARAAVHDWKASRPAVGRAWTAVKRRTVAR